MCPDADKFQLKSQNMDEAINLEFIVDLSAEK